MFEINPTYWVGIFSKSYAGIECVLHIEQMAYCSVRKLDYVKERKRRGG